MLPSLACLPTGGVAEQPKKRYMPGEVALREIRQLDKQIEEKRKQREEDWAFDRAQLILAGDPDRELLKERIEAVLRTVKKSELNRMNKLLVKALKTLMEAKAVARDAGYRAGGYRPVYGHQRRPRRR